MKIKILSTAGDDSGFHVGQIVTPACVHETQVFLRVNSTKGHCCREHGNSWQLTEKDYEIVEEDKKINIKQIMSKPLETFLLALKSEPDKSLIKSGLMNSDGTLTDEGKKVWDVWMLNKNKEAFKTEVADPILTELKESK